MDNPVIRDSVGFQFILAGRQHEKYFTQALEELDLNLGQELVIAQLAETDGISQSQLSDDLSVRPPSITSIVQRLEEDDLVERREDPDDARSRQVFLTPDGEDMIEPIEVFWNRTEEVMLDGFTTEERPLLRRLLIQLRENMRVPNEATK